MGIPASDLSAVGFVGIIAIAVCSGAAADQSATSPPSTQHKPIAAAGTDDNGADLATQTRVRELVYILRNCRVSERDEEWAAAVRELVEFGSSALPELLLELRTTERSATARAILFTVRAINDPRAMEAVVAAIPKAVKLSKQGSDFGLIFADPELHRFMKANQNFPRDKDDDNWVSYGRPINEILSTLHKLSKVPLPDLTKQGRHVTWEVGYWQAKWDTDRKENKIPTAVELPVRDDDLVERDGVCRFGPLFPTGPAQRLSPAVEVALPNNAILNALAFLDLESGKLYEPREGMYYGPEKRRDPADDQRWNIQNGIDLQVNGGCDLHLWMIDNARWDSLDAEVRADKPLDIGREALMMVPFENNAWDFKPDKVGTFLFTTREGGRGVIRAYPYVKTAGTRKFEYRLWNREKIEPHAASQAKPRHPNEWQPAKVVVLKKPGFGNQCFYSFKRQQVETLPATIFDADSRPTIEELLRQGSLVGNDRVAKWVRSRDIELATIRGQVGFAGQVDQDAMKTLDNGQMLQLMLLDAREMQITAESFGSLSVARAKEILDRDASSFRLAYMSPPLYLDARLATYVFETKSEQIGLLQIMKIADKASTIIFQYELAKMPDETSTTK